MWSQFFVISIFILLVIWLLKQYFCKKSLQHVHHVSCSYEQLESPRIDHQTKQTVLVLRTLQHLVYLKNLEIDKLKSKIENIEKTSNWELEQTIQKKDQLIKKMKAEMDKLLTNRTGDDVLRLYQEYVKMHQRLLVMDEALRQQGVNIGNLPTLNIPPKISFDFGNFQQKGIVSPSLQQQQGLSPSLQQQGLSSSLQQKGLPLDMNSLEMKGKHYYFIKNSPYY